MKSEENRYVRHREDTEENNLEMSKFQSEISAFLKVCAMVIDFFLK